MTFINKFGLIGCVTVLAALTAGCTDKKEDEPTVTGTPISIETSIIINSPVITQFDNGHEMNLFARKTSRLDSESLSTNAKATNASGNEWNISPAVVIPGNITSMYLFAAYPYVDNVDPAAYPINLDQQADVMYSGGGTAVSHQSSRARLRMKHALAMMSFDIDASTYSGAGALTGIVLDGEEVYSQGTMDISNGKITPTKQGQVTSSEKFDLKNSLAGTANFWIIPFSVTENVVATIVFTIDGKQYKVNVPPAKMVTGFQYQFHLILTDNGLVIMPEVGEISLNADEDNFNDPEGFGIVKFVTTASAFSFPVFNGENVFGNVASGSQSVNYTLGGSLNLSGSGNQTVTVETWSSTGFEIESLENIESIDISNY